MHLPFVTCNVTSSNNQGLWTACKGNHLKTCLSQTFSLVFAITQSLRVSYSLFMLINSSMQKSVIVSLMFDETSLSLYMAMYLNLVLISNIKDDLVYLITKPHFHGTLSICIPIQHKLHRSVIDTHMTSLYNSQLT